MRRLARFLLPGILGVALAAAVIPAAAHPMGNFSINHFSSLLVGTGRVQVLYIVDMAEIPTFQELDALHGSDSTRLAPAQRASYLARKAKELAAGLSLTMNGRPVQLSLQADDLIFPPGAGGLATERLYLVLNARISQAGGTLVYRDGNFPGRAGWKEIVARPARGTRLARSSVPSTSRSRRLTVYPSSVAESMPQTVSATLTLRTSPSTSPALTMPAPMTLIRQAQGPLLCPGGAWSPLAQGLTRTQGQVASAGRACSSSTSSWAGGRIDVLTNLMSHRQLPFSFLLLSLIVAFWFGATHALSPGHGKTVVAAYLVGSRGTPLHAAFLGLTVTLTHTAGVFALGLVTLYFSRYVLPDQLYPILGFVSGMLVAGMGLTLFVRRLRALRRLGDAVPSGEGLHAALQAQDDHVHPHEHEHHMHDHDHDHGHAHGHDHGQGHDNGHEHHHHDEGVPHRHGPFGRAHTHATLPGENGERVTVRSLLALGISGGLLPCPSALVVLLSAIAFHRLVFGMILIVAFSAGLATTLTSIGLLVVWGGKWMRRMAARRSSSRLIPAAGRAARLLPIFSALVVACLGTAIALGALGTGGIPAL